MSVLPSQATRDELADARQAAAGDARKHGRNRFTLGKGGATLELESFQGTITVDRPGIIDRAAAVPRGAGSIPEEGD